MSLLRYAALAALLLGIAACGSGVAEEQSSQQEEEKLDVTVSILPQKYFVEKVGGDRVRVNVMVEKGMDPHTYEPKPQQLRALSEAEIYASIGIEFEDAWMERIQSANPEMPVIDSTAGIERIEMVAHHHHHGEEHAHHHEGEKEHAHDHEGEHGNLDPHVWLSPRLVKVQAENIYNALVKIDPENQEKYKGNLDKFLAEIDALDSQISQNLTGLSERKFIVFHPSWGYFARDYNLEQEPIEVQGQEPSAAELSELISEAKADGIKVIFAQPQFSTKSAKAIAQEIQGEVLLADPLAPNWSANLLSVSETFAKVLNSEQVAK